MKWLLIAVVAAVPLLPVFMEINRATSDLASITKGALDDTEKLRKTTDVVAAGVSELKEGIRSLHDRLD